MDASTTGETSVCPGRATGSAGGEPTTKNSHCVDFLELLNLSEEGARSAPESAEPESSNEESDEEEDAGNSDEEDMFHIQALPTQELPSEYRKFPLSMALRCWRGHNSPTR